MQIKKIYQLFLLFIVLLGMIFKINADNISSAPIINKNTDDVISTNNDITTPQDDKNDQPTNSQNEDSQDEDDNQNDTPQKPDAIGEILIQATSLMGIAYKWGGNTPETGMDCSGFIKYVFKTSMGVTLPRTVSEMARVGIKVKLSEIKPGDLIFFNTLRGRRNSHIGMYVGNNQFIHSPRTGESIKISQYNSYWRSHTNGVKRIVAQNVDADGHIQEVKTFENVRNQSLPSGKIKTKLKKRTQKLTKQLKQNKTNTGLHNKTIKKSNHAKKTSKRKLHKNQ